MDTRLSKLRSQMLKQKLDAVLISSIPNIIYLTDFSGFGTKDRDAFLLITNTHQYLFTHAIYRDAAMKFIKKFELIGMNRENPTGESIKKLIINHSIKKLGFEDANLSVWEFERLFKKVNKKILLPTGVVSQLRTIKNTDEIDAIKNACALGDKAYSHIQKSLRIGMSEKDVAFELEYFIRKNGGEISFTTIVAFGENAAYIHHEKGNRRLKSDEFVLLDFGVKLNNYCSDMSRTFFFGKARADDRKSYQSVLKSQQNAIDYIEEKLSKKEKIQGEMADKISRDYLVSQGFPNLPYSLGHGIGLEVHEAPRLTPAYKQILENGMVFSIEPGIYLTGKFGIRIEDLFAIENNKLIPLTHSPKDLIEIK